MTLTQQIGAVVLVLAALGIYVEGWRSIRRWFR